MPKHFLSLANLTPGELEKLVDETIALKADPLGQKPLAGKSVALLFTKSSTRTRLAFEVGIHQLGGQAIFLNPSEIQLGRGESLRDTAKVMERYIHALVVRTYKQEELLELAEAISIPVVNALTDMFHPCQGVADFATIKEKKGTIKGLKVAYVGDGNNVAHSLMLAGAMLGANVAIATPINYEPHKDVTAKAASYLEHSGGTLDITNNPSEAVENADVVYTDVWVSMGQEDEAQRRLEAFNGYIVDGALMARAKKDAIAMHCLPAYRGKEISSEVLDGPQSVVWDQAENKLHAQKAVLKTVMGD